MEAETECSGPPLPQGCRGCKDEEETDGARAAAEGARTSGAAAEEARSEGAAYEGPITEEEADEGPRTEGARIEEEAV